MVLSFEFFSISKILLFIEVFALLIKFYVLFFLGSKAFKSSKISKSLLFLFFALVGSIVIDFTWIIKLVREIYIPTIDYRILLFFIRLAWAFSLVQYQSLSLFIESLSDKQYNLRVGQKLLLGLNGFCIFYFLYIMFFSCLESSQTWLEKNMIGFSSWIMLLILILPCFLVLKKLQTPFFPKILKKQITVLLLYLIFPFIVTELVQSFFIFSQEDSYIITGISTIILTIAICYCVHRIMGLRFLNFQQHVQAPKKFDFIIEFKRVLEDLGYSSSLNEINHILQGFFKDAFGIASSKTALYMRKNELMTIVHPQVNELNPKEIIVENFLVHNENFIDVMKKTKIFIKDEVVFSNFYQESEIYKRIVEFLDQLDADIFLPIFEKNILVGYIIIECNARGKNRFFSDVEHDELVVVAGYLGKVINLLYYGSINAVLAREKELSEEVYHQNRQITQYQECLGSFMRTEKQRKIGLLFYKYRRFVFANQAAKEIININVNMQDGHPLTQALKRVAQEVESYKSTQTIFAHDPQGNRLVLLGIPNLERQNVIIIVYYPEISDVLKYQMDKIGNPTDWHYVLCLETTKSGQLINQMIPGSGPQLMKFKVDLLRTSIGKKALFLDMAADDALPTAEIVHYISLRKSLYHLKVDPKASMNDVAIKLFGINPLYGTRSSKEQDIAKPLFEQLHDSGTLFIEDVHLLDLEIQNTLANYIKYGHYSMYKSSHKLFSSVRIICSAQQNLQSLVQEGKFSKMLFDELQEEKLTLPSFMNLPEEELEELIKGFTEQAVETSPLQNLLELSAYEKFKMMAQRPVSLQEFKNVIKNALVKKSQKQEIFHEIKFDAAYTIADPELAQAAKLGKKALKDPKILAMLLRKLKTQSKVADFLGVNRSSINRRLKKYKLI